MNPNRSGLSGMRWQAGKKLQGGRYEIKEIDNEEQLSVTYRAVTSKGEWVLIKTPNDKTLSSSEFARFQEEFNREAFKLARCKHPHIVRAEDPFLEDALRCVPMEYIQGMPLEQRKQEESFSESEALDYIHQIGEALTVVHGERLYHRDVNPANIMLRSRDGQLVEAVLTNFRLARAFDLAPTETRREEITLGYAPPELYSRHRNRGPYTDIYSLGATLYNLLTGKIPPDAEEREARRVPIDFPSEVKIDDRIKRAIRWAMEMEPQKRPQSVQEWLNFLGSPTTKQQKTFIGWKNFKKIDWMKIGGVLIGIATFAGGFGALISGVVDGCEILPALCSKLTPSSPSSSQNP